MNVDPTKIDESAIEPVAADAPETPEQRRERIERIVASRGLGPHAYTTGDGVRPANYNASR